MGNDEHSQNVFRKARELKLAPLEYCDEMEQQFRTVWKRLDISFDDFIRTTEPRHRAAVETLVRRSRYDAGDIYDGEYEGWYCVSCEAFKQEKDLVEGLCPIHKTRPDWIKERNYFFRLSAYRDRLLQHYADTPGVRRTRIAPQRDAAAARSGPRGHLGEPRGTGVGHSAAVRPGERRVRLVRRAHQLRGGGRLWLRRREVRALVAGGPASGRQGHHAVPLRRLAGDADERRAWRCRSRCSGTAGCSPRARR